MRRVIVFLCLPTLAMACSTISFAQSRLLYAQPNAITPIDSFNEGVRQGQERRQRDLEYRAQLENLQRQQRLRALSAEFWASDNARKWQLLPDIAAIDPDIAGQYQASIEPDEAPKQSIIYKCANAEGAIKYTLQAEPGCTVIMADQSQ